METFLPYKTQKLLENNFQLKIPNLEATASASKESLYLLTTELWSKIQNGLTLADVENVIVFILFIRFIILAVKYNLKTSFYILCIATITGLFWYYHLIYLLDIYRYILMQSTFLQKVGTDVNSSHFLMRYTKLLDSQLEKETHWYNISQTLYYAVKNGILRRDSETGFRYLIDPISMAISSLPEILKSKILPAYYIVYYDLVPMFSNVLSYLWNDIGRLAIYIFITRLGRRFCPYLIRWHWTMLIVVQFVEGIFVDFICRVFYFRNITIANEMELFKTHHGYADPNLLVQSNWLELAYISMIVIHIGFIFLALLHAVSGQYFYIPFITENTEVHTGRRSKTDVYSGGNTPWQDTKNKGFFSKIWISWFSLISVRDARLRRIFRKIRKKIWKMYKNAR